MPYPQEHACRLKDPDDFESDSFRRSSRESDGKRYDVIMGRLTGEDMMTEQAYRYPKDTWTVSDARAHCNDHDGISFEPASGEEDVEDSACCGAQARAQHHEPFRCFDGKAKPHEPFWLFRNAIDGEEPEMELYGYISEYSWWEDEISPKFFKDDLYRYGAGGPITIRMNSYGGDVIAASIISTIIKDYPGRVTVQVDGVAASAATVVAVAGDRIRMQETSYFMIHDPLAVFFLAALNIEELTRMADSLRAIKEGIVNAYETKTGLSRTRLSKLMTDETWMDAQRAVDLGFADEIIHGMPKQIEIPENAAVVNALRNFVNLPEPLKALLSSRADPVIQPAKPGRTQFDKATDRLRAEAKLYVKE